MQQKIHALKELDSIWFNTSHIIEKKLYSSKQPGKEVKMCEEKTSEEFVVPYRDAPSNIQYYMDKLSNVTEEKSMVNYYSLISIHHHRSEYRKKKIFLFFRI